MQDHTTEQELKDRLSLIESMIAEGRRTTESWGWTFVLWGVAYYISPSPGPRGVTLLRRNLKHLTSCPVNVPGFEPQLVPSQTRGVIAPK